MHYPSGNATDSIWRVLASSDGISFWTPLKPQHNNTKPNPNPLVNQLWCIDFLTPPTPLIIPHRLSAFLESHMPHKNWCSIHARCSKSSLKYSIRFCGLFSNFKTQFYCISFFLTSRLHFLKFTSCDNQALVGCIPIPAVDVHLKLKFIKIGQSSHKMYSNKILNFQESTTIFKCLDKKVWKLIEGTT